MTQLEGSKRYVPFADKYHVPDWAEHHASPEFEPIDTPIKDGITGTIALKLEAITPLFAAFDQTGTKDTIKEKHWLELDGTRAIQGTSIKGMIRAALEIATFGKFKERIDDRKLSIRDLHNKEDYINHLSDMFRPLSKAGWLTPSSQGWTLEPCHWSLVRQSDLERHHDRRIDLGRRQPAGKKYSAWGWGNRQISFTALRTSTEGDFAKGREVSRAAHIGNGEHTGTIVFTGQPNDRKNNKKAKSTEFIFHGQAGEAMPIPDQIRRDFEQIHRDENGDPNEEWQNWLQQARKFNNKVPVFWLENDDGSIRAMGLAMMFRLAYRHSLHDAAPQSPSDAKYDWDFADILFGRVLDDQQNAKNLNLKGRAQFGHFKQTNDTPLDKPQEAVLLAPKYGFYPSLITQKHLTGTPPKADPYTTLQDPNARLRGPARYMASRGTKIPPKQQSDTDKILTRFQPVGKGAVFEGKLRVFNLRPEELGALIWILHWGSASSSAKHAHMLGMAKAFGLGACQISIDTQKTRLTTNANYSHDTGADSNLIAQAVDAFTAYMENAAKVSGQTWLQSPQIKELLASVDLDHGDKLRAAGKLDPMTGPKAFVDAKRDKLVQPRPSGDYDAKSKAPAAKPQGRDQRQKPAAPRQQTWSAGDEAFYVDEGEIVTVVSAPRGSSVMIQFDDGDEMEVDVSLLTTP